MMTGGGNSKAKGKRGGRSEKEGKKSKGTSGGAAMVDDEDEEPELEFEGDAFEDEEDEEMVDEEDEEELEADSEEARARVLQQIEADEAGSASARVWDPRQECPEGEEMEYDPRAYRMLHRLNGEWPCLSFDFITDEGGGGRTRFPHELLAVAGTQSEDASSNKLTLMWLEGLTRMEKDDEDDSDDDDSEDEEEEEEDVAKRRTTPMGEPILEHASFAHPGGVNRVSASATTPGLVASWSDDGKVRIWDAREELGRFCNRGLGPRPAGMIRRKPIATMAHDDEGYALSWSKLDPGVLASGDNSGNLRVWQAGNAGGASCTAHFRSFLQKGAAVEDVAFSPTEKTVMMCCATDGSISVLDVRAKKGPMLSLPGAHESDINALSWNTAVSYLVATGGDDGAVKVWDLRAFGSTETTKPVGRFDWHKGKAIAALQWDPHDESSISVAAADNTVTLWDLSVEDASNAASALALETPGAQAAADLPPQLLFVHQGLTDPKDVKHHPQIPNLIMTTAADGFNLFIAAL